MKLTFVGSGDAFGSGGRVHTCMRLDTDGRVILVDFGASALLGWKRMGFDTNEIDAILLSHLHGDHFGAIPFLLLESQFIVRRKRPLIIAGPPGTRARINTLVDVLFPGCLAIPWSFAWEVREIEPLLETQILDCRIRTIEVVHPSGAPSTGVRLNDGASQFAYSGDTEWTPSLIEIAGGADLFVTECYSGVNKVPNHIDWPTLQLHLPELKARRRVVTHMAPSALAKKTEFESAGLIFAEDGLILDI